MRYFLVRNAVLKWLEKPSVYHIGSDELYELDNYSFEFLKNCASKHGCATEDREFLKYCLDEGILTEQKTVRRRPVPLKSPDPSLRYLELQITDRCNLKCKHCYIAKSESKELQVETIRKILSEFEDVQGLRLLITGGEPLIHSNFSRINQMLSDYAFRKVLLTNGVLLKRNIIASLNVEEVQISIDGLKTAHDELRGTGSFDAAMKALKECLNHGLDVSVSTMVHRRNLDDFDEMEQLLKNIGIKDWTVDVPCRSGRLLENADFSVSPEIGGKYLKYCFGGGIHEGEQGFGCGLHLMSVMADGMVAKCAFYSERPVGHVKKGLRKCWQMIEPVRLDSLKCDCRHIDICRGGCRFRAEVSDGPQGKDLYRCSYFDIIKT